MIELLETDKGHLIPLHRVDWIRRGDDGTSAIATVDGKSVRLIEDFDDLVHAVRRGVHSREADR